MTSDFRIETLGGGITLMTIGGVVEDLDSELYQALSQLSKKRSHVLIDLSALKTGGDKLYNLLNDLSSRTKMKIIATEGVVVSRCKTIGLPTFPTVKSASLSYAGDETINLMLGMLRDVPILNTEAYRLIHYVSQPDSSFNKLEIMIKDNPGLCSQIFRMANSSYFKRTTRAETIQQALVVLGFSTLRQLFCYNFYTSVGNVFRAQQDVIQHGKQCALLAEYICRSGGGTPDECSKVRMGGLLHDIGRQALAFFFPKQYEKVYTLINDEGKPSYMAELMVFGTEHQTVGSILAAKWNFPEHLCTIIGDHHYLQAAHWNAFTLPIFVANSFLNERAKQPFHPYYQKLEGFFFLKRKELPWKDIVESFNKFLDNPEDPFV